MEEPAAYARQESRSALMKLLRPVLLALFGLTLLVSQAPPAGAISGGSDTLAASWPTWVVAIERIGLGETAEWRQVCTGSLVGDS